MNTVLLMILGHLVADYTLQGWLADGKQKSWWDKICGGKVLDKEYKPRRKSTHTQPRLFDMPTDRQKRKEVNHD